MSNGYQGKRFEVFTIRERANQEKGFWVKIGAAFENKDGSLSVNLDALPLTDKNGECRLQIRAPRPRDEQSQQSNRSAARYSNPPHPADGGDF